ncbi:MAG: hypothetical protein AAFP97_12565, partial [Pseudomonadota bacterium]
SVISAQQLVTLPLGEIISLGQKHGCRWPNHMPGYFLLRSEFGAYENQSDFRISLARVDTKSLGSSTEQIDALYPIDSLEVGAEVQIKISNASARYGQALVFLGYDDDYVSRLDEDQAFSLRCLLRISDLATGDTLLNHPDGDPFRVLPGTGLFSLYGFSFSANLDLDRVFGMILEENKPLSNDETNTVIQTIKRMTIDDPKAVGVASYAYKV